MENKVRNLILQEADPNYKKFSASLIPNIDNVLGVRLPILRKIAMKIHKTEDWQSFLEVEKTEFMEEIMLQGMIIGLIKAEPEVILDYVRSFVPKINNWAVCDTFCAGLKFTNKNKQLVWKFLQPYLESKKEYEIRFGAVMLLDFFVDDEYIEKVLTKLDRIKTEDYYAQMAIAWAVSVCMAKFPEKTFKYLQISQLEKWIFNKSIQKSIESFRITDEMKKELKKLLKKS